jgi:hypothetical protein
MLWPIVELPEDVNSRVEGPGYVSEFANFKCRPHQLISRFFAVTAAANRAQFPAVLES